MSLSKRQRNILVSHANSAQYCAKMGCTQYAFCDLASSQTAVDVQSNTLKYFDTGGTLARIHAPGTKIWSDTPVSTEHHRLVWCICYSFIALNSLSLCCSFSWCHHSLQFAAEGFSPCVKGANFSVHQTRIASRPSSLMV